MASTSYSTFYHNCIFIVNFHIVKLKLFKMKLVFYCSLHVSVELVINGASQNVGNQSLAAGCFIFFQSYHILKWISFYFLHLRQESTCPCEICGASVKLGEQNPPLEMVGEPLTPVWILPQLNDNL